MAAAPEAGPGTGGGRIQPAIELSQHRGASAGAPAGRAGVLLPTAPAMSVLCCMRLTHLLIPLLLAAFALCTWPALAQERFELEPEYVYGKNRTPRLGYRKPEVFDPLIFRMFQAGYKDYPPTAIPDELKEVDAMTRVQGMGRILACADGWFWPFLRAVRENGQNQASAQARMRPMPFTRVIASTSFSSSGMAVGG